MSAAVLTLMPLPLPALPSRDAMRLASCSLSPATFSSSRIPASSRSNELP